MRMCALTVVSLVLLGLTPFASAGDSGLHPITGDGLIAYYPFNEDCRDYSGNDNHGRAYGGPAWASGPVGAALHLDGIDDYVQIVPKSDVSKIGDFTVSVWTYMKSYKQQPENRRDRQYTGAVLANVEEGMMWGLAGHTAARH